ncbi:MAG: LytTR family transcriptional regulator [Spirosomaceae bacterium]|nr:LytTR family transcriptional regulator [Spirosomataceae bacterium]MDP5140074.1 LytTR family transcriptional regulator [Spirosomataceae bacterium]
MKPFLNLNQHKQIPFFRIIYLESDANYTYVHTTTAKKALSSYTIGVLYKQLDKHMFYRANRKLVFNLHFVEEIWYDGEYVFLNLVTGKEVALSRRQSSLFKIFLKKNFGFKIPHRYETANVKILHLTEVRSTFKLNTQTQYCESPVGCL